MHPVNEGRGGDRPASAPLESATVQSYKATDTIYIKNPRQPVYKHIIY